MQQNILRVSITLLPFLKADKNFTIFTKFLLKLSFVKIF